MADEENPTINENNDSVSEELIRNKKLNTLTVSNMDDILSRRKDLPDDLACFLQQQKQRQARLETTMRSFPSTEDMDQDKGDFKKKRNAHEDPMSHRIIEKRRRDRMNNCLADLSRLIPSSYLKKGRGRIEKTEIIEMAIKHIRHLQSHPCTKQEGCELASEIESGLNKTTSVESFRVGYHECLTEIMHFLVEREGLYSGNSFCVRLMSHLQKHFDKLGRASTSELFSAPGRSWQAPSRDQDNKDESRLCVDKEKVKSEFGVNSEESGYKTDEASGLASAAQDDVSHPRWPPEQDPIDLTSDLSISGQSKDKLSFGEDLNIPVTGASLYKFKSNIRHRFDSSRSVDDDKDVIFTGKRTRMDSTSTDGNPIYDDLELRRDCLSPPSLESNHVRHRSGPGIDLSTSPLPGPSSVLPKQYIPVFALSNNGAYYVPLSVETDSLLPFLPSLAENAPGPFHPVTISVKFASFLNPSTSSSVPPINDGTDSDSWRNLKRGGVIQAPQSVIKQNWRDGGPT